MRVLRLVQFVIVVALAIGLTSPLVVSAQRADITCDDFTTQEAAQAVLDLGPGADVEEALDPDGNGVACDEAEEDDPEENTNSGLPTRRGSNQSTDDPEEEPTEEPERESSRNAMDARFGGTRESFEDEYGDPVSDDAGEYPLGFDYEIEGFGNVNIYYHKDYVAYITLEAERRDAWTERQAERVVEDFLPTDVEVDDPFETDDGDLLTPAHSRALERRYGEGTYERYGASGEQGDLYYLFRYDRDGDVDTIEIGLGNDVQREPQADEPVDDPDEPTENGELTDADMAYLQELRGQFDIVSRSMDDFQTTLDGLTAGTLDAGDAGAQLRVIFDTWRQAQADAQNLNPPPGSQSTHDLYIDMVDLLAAAAEDYTNGLLNSDNSLLEAGDEKYNQASTLAILLDALLTGSGV